MLGFDRLDARKTIAMVLLANKLLNGYICNSDVLELIALHVPDNFTRARKYRLFIFPNFPLIMALGTMVTFLFIYDCIMLKMK